MFCSSLFVLFLLVIVLSVLHRFMDSVYLFGIFKLFLSNKKSVNRFVNLLENDFLSKYYVII